MLALRAASPAAAIDYVDGRDVGVAVSAAKAADVVIVVATQWQTEGQDAPSLTLPGNQDALIAAVAQANLKTVVILQTGGAVLMPWLDRVAAVVAAWYPGQRGGEALAQLLMGNVDFSGRLPLSFSRSEAQLPRASAVMPAGLGEGQEITSSFPIDYSEGADVGYRWHALKREAPLFPFGYGLSYTRFSHGNVRFTGGRVLGASFTVRNTGARAGTVVTQLYLTGPEGRSPRLAGWHRASLAPGETVQAEIAADPRILPRRTRTGWHVPTGMYRLALGSDAMREIASGSVIVDEPAAHDWSATSQNAQK